MMASISTQIADTAGSILLRLDMGKSKLGEMARRVSRTATLDGGAVVVDSGFSHGDRTLVLSGRLTETDETTLKTLMQTYSLVTLAIPDGAYSGVIERLTVNHGAVEIRFLIKEKVS